VASSCCGTYPAIQWTLGTLNSVLVLLWSALCLVLQPHASHISHLLFAAGEFEPIEGMTGQLRSGQLGVVITIVILSAVVCSL
jgi:hypothetical protein